MKPLHTTNTIKHIGISSQLIDLKLALDASGNVESSMQLLDLEGKQGKGCIKNADFKNGMSVTQYDLKLYDDFSFKLYNDNKNYIYFFYALDGDFYQNFTGKEKHVLIEELRTTVIGANSETNCEIHLSKLTHFKFSIISIERDTYFEKLKQRYKTSDEDLNKLFKALDTVKNKVYKCSYNLKIANQLRLLDNTRLQFNITNLQHYEGHFQIILAQHLEHFCSEIFGERIMSTLSKTELKKIRTITDYIIDNPMLHHTIKNLCERALLSPAKLQEGFKCMHKTTVSNYIKNVRVEKSRDLLIYTDHNVSEIAYMVGFTSRSYFCKIFREKFGFSATQYRSKYKEKEIDLNHL